jgi:hypothetical protein
MTHTMLSGQVCLEERGATDHPIAGDHTMRFSWHHGSRTRAHHLLPALKFAPPVCPALLTLS